MNTVDKKKYAYQIWVKSSVITTNTYFVFFYSEQIKLTNVNFDKLAAFFNPNVLKVAGFLTNCPKAPLALLATFFRSALCGNFVEYFRILPTFRKIRKS